MSSLKARLAKPFTAYSLALSILLGSIAVSGAPTTLAASSITVGGTAVVSNTGGDTIRVREDAGTQNGQVAEAHEGDVVPVIAGPRKDSQGNYWYEIEAPSGTGWIRSDFLSAQGSSSSSSSKASSGLSGSAHVANTDGDQLRMRLDPSTGANIVTLLDANTTVTIKDGPLADDSGVAWYKVSAGGNTGWVMGQYLASGAGSSSSSSSASSQSSKSSSQLSGSAHVANTDGDPLRVRSSPSTSGDIVTLLTADSSVIIKDGPVTDSDGVAWYKVNAGGTIGWAMAQYLGQSGSSSASSSSSQSSTSSSKLTGTAQVANTDGDPLRVRTSPSKSGDVVTMISSDSKVTVKSGPVTDSEGITWYKVNTGGTTGWAMAQYLDQAVGSSSSSASKPAAQPAASTSKPASNSNNNSSNSSSNSSNSKPAVQTKSASRSSAAAKPAIQTSPAAAPAAKPRVAAQPKARALTTNNVRTVVATDTSSAASVGASIGAGGSGSAIVSVAMKYVGYRYVYGGTTPSGFDCSGFVYWVLNHAGVPISRDMSSQYNSGPHVSSNALQPGDLVFFAGTYKAGLSHVAIYIGNGQIVHAENESTGVVVSQLWTAYWINHYAGATRPAP